MFNNANSENADRRHIKFPIVCSAYEKKTELPMISALIKKMEIFFGFRFHQSNNQTIHAENGVKNGTLGSIKLNFMYL